MLIASHVSADFSGGFQAVGKSFYCTKIISFSLLRLDMFLPCVKHLRKYVTSGCKFCCREWQKGQILKFLTAMPLLHQILASCFHPLKWHQVCRLPSVWFHVNTACLKHELDIFNRLWMMNSAVGCNSVKVRKVTFREEQQNPFWHETPSVMKCVQSKTGRLCSYTSCISWSNQQRWHVWGEEPVQRTKKIKQMWRTCRMCVPSVKVTTKYGQNS